MAAALVLGGGGAAFAYWTSQGTGAGGATTGESVDFTVASAPPAGDLLFPGGPGQSVEFTVTNPGTTDQTLSSVIVAVAEPLGAVWNEVPGCSAADYTVGTPEIDYGPIAAGGTATGTVTLTMNVLGGDQNACQNAVVPLYIVAA